MLRSATVPGARGRDQRGFALLLALTALAVVAGFVAWGMFLGLYAFRGGRNAVLLAHAFAAAEEGARLTLLSGEWSRYAALGVGERAAFHGEVRSGTGAFRGAVTRLSRDVFLVTAEGLVAHAAARQRLGILVRLGHCPKSERPPSPVPREPPPEPRPPSCAPIPLAQRSWVQLD